jgi:hypothetical protein
MSAKPRTKPANVDASKKLTSDCQWCCDNTHRGIAGALTCNACSNTGHKPSCATRT